jgi:microcystin degradation protein MlrC
MTPEMVRYASAMVGYRTYPHINMAETGGRVVRF